MQTTSENVCRRSIFSLFVDNDSHWGALESQSFRNVFVTISKLINVSINDYDIVFLLACYVVNDFLISLEWVSCMNVSSVFHKLLLNTIHS